MADKLFNSELTYFKLGLEWNQRWNLTNILSTNGIRPSTTKPYKTVQFHDAIKSTLGKSPFLDCFYYEVYSFIHFIIFFNSMIIVDYYF